MNVGIFKYRWRDAGKIIITGSLCRIGRKAWRRDTLMTKVERLQNVNRLPLGKGTVPVWPRYTTFRGRMANRRYYKLIGEV